MARVYWPNTLSEADGLYSVIRLVPLTRIDHSVNLFETVPTAWTRERSLLDRAKELWSQMSESQQRLFNEIFWDVRLFWRYICVPASINSHHNGRGGNLRYVVELAEHAERISLEVGTDSGGTSGIDQDCWLSQRVHNRIGTSLITGGF